jgi:GNAT superfamily N-acetyltransferase
MTASADLVLPGGGGEGMNAATRDCASLPGASTARGYVQAHRREVARTAPSLPHRGERRSGAVAGVEAGAILLANGRRFPLRPIAPTDAAAVQDFVRDLSPQSRYARFFSPIRELSPDQLERMTRTRYPDRFGLVALDPLADGRRIAGIAQHATADDDTPPEFAVVVDDRWQRQGLGAQLLVRLAEHARSAGYPTLEGLVLAGNHPMLALAGKLGCTLRTSWEPGILRVEARLS